MIAGTTLNFDFQKYSCDRREFIEQRLKECLSNNQPAVLWESMRYSVLEGGKRFRGLLCLASAETVEAGSTIHRLPAHEVAWACACATELVHAMSLIHDDLPVMDNDDFRRGRPTNHKVFGEAMALLAGDALLAMASEILITRTPEQIDPSILLNVAAELTRASGANGMVGGQVEDMVATGQIVLPPGTKGDVNRKDLDNLESIHRKKTGALIRFSSWAGGRLMGASPKHLEILQRFGELLGLAFQIADDLLDVTGDITTLGKTPGKDEATGKLTWVRIYGVEQSKKQLSQLEAEGKALLSQLNVPANATAPLSSLLELAIHRKN